MFLHISKSESVYKKSIIGIFDIDNATLSKDTRYFLADMQDRKAVVNLCDDLPKSFVLTEDGMAEAVYLTTNSASSLLKRTKEI